MQNNYNIPPEVIRRSSTNLNSYGIDSRGIFTTTLLHTTLNGLESGIPMIRIETDRLLARLGGDADAIPLNELYTGRVDESKYLARLPHNSPEATGHFIRSWSTNDSWISESRIALIIEDKNSGLPIGVFIIFNNNGDLEFHFGLSSDFSGRGLATELAKEFVDKARSTEEINSIYAYCDMEHEASQTVIEHSGLVAKGIVKAKYFNPNQGKEIDCIEYYLKL